MTVQTFFGISLGITVAACIGYCIYFDRKRCSSPDYKKKVHERRMREREARTHAMSVPHTNDVREMEKFFLKEFNIGEELIHSGDYESAMDHFANAIMVCNHPERVLQVLRVSLPTEAFTLLLGRMQEFARRVACGYDRSIEPNASTLAYHLE